MQLGNTPTTLLRAPLRPYGLFGRFCYSPESSDTAGTTSGDAAKEAIKDAAHKAAPTVPDTTGKLLLTQEELDAKVQAALTAAQAKADAKAKKEREAAEAEEAKKRGEFEKVATAEKERADKAEREARSLRQSIALRDHLAEKHPDYVGCAKYIAPLIPADAEGDDLAKQVETAAAQYVKDNPRSEKNKAGAPAPLPRTGNRPNNPEARSPRQQSAFAANGNRIVPASSRF